MSADKTVVIVASIDDAFAEPLLVTLRSAAVKISPGWRMDVYVIENKLKERSRQIIKAGLDDLPVNISWLPLDLSHVRDHWPGIESDGDLAIYARLYIGELLPDSVDRALYLDADLLIEGNLVDLWEQPFEGHIIQAVPDAYAALLHTPRLAKIKFSGAERFEADQPYFNAGVQLIDLDRWRKEKIASITESLLWQHRSEFFMREQDALNCALVGRWKPLPPTWNFHELPDLLGRWDTSSLSAGQLRSAFHNPAIVHYVGWKPWNPRCGNFNTFRWWRVADELGVERAGLPPLARFWHRFLRLPHAGLNWHIWRNIVQLRERSAWRQIGRLLLKNPWTILTYPLWLIAVQLRLGLTLLKPQRR